MNDRDCENCKHHTEKGCDSWDCKFERKVTRKETIKVFENMKKGIYPYDPNVYLDIAINSLEIDERYELEYEQIEPCEDAISRQAVLDYIDKMPSELTTDGRRMIRRRTLEEYISDTLPSVNPQEPTDTWSIKDVADTFKKHGLIVEQEPKTGHWIKYSVPRCGEQHYQCTSCEYYINFGQWGEVYTKQFKFCPNCGAKMVESQERSGEEV